ncbi:MAG TPA: hypothetical protein VE596_19130 [Gaiellaceae bacterium]|jgi:hypothetical protein|nr:hypothetical protein [Gaiellaceae bacterium]
MRITRNAVARSCAICERTLLMGERAMRFSPDGDGEFVDVCPLCQEIALDHAWVKEGSPTAPTMPFARRRRRGLGALFERAPAEKPVVSEPILRRLSETELEVVEAADLFNSSPFRRTVGGIAKSLGEPRASILPLSGVNRELVITIAWDISWYQYRVSFDSAQPIRLAERGLELDELESSFTAWNSRVTPDGRIVPSIERY